MEEWITVADLIERLQDCDPNKKVVMVVLGNEIPVMDFIDGEEVVKLYEE